MRDPREPLNELEISAITHISRQSCPRTDPESRYRPLLSSNQSPTSDSDAVQHKRCHTDLVSTPRGTQSPVPDRRASHAADSDFHMDHGGYVADFRFVVRDRAGQFTDSFDAVLVRSSSQEPKIPPPESSGGFCRTIALTARVSGGTRLQATRQGEARRLEGDLVCFHQGRPGLAVQLVEQREHIALHQARVGRAADCLVAEHRRICSTPAAASASSSAGPARCV